MATQIDDARLNTRPGAIRGRFFELSSNVWKVITHDWTTTMKIYHWFIAVASTLVILLPEDISSDEKVSLTNVISSDDCIEK